jgi:hypothetical protein
MELKDKIAVAIAGISLLISGISIFQSSFRNQEFSVTRTDDVFISNQLGPFPKVKTQYSFVSNGPNTKTTTISNIMMTITRSDGKKWQLFPKITSNTSSIPINLSGNVSYTYPFEFTVKQNSENIDLLDTWAKSLSAEYSDENEKNKIMDVAKRFSGTFELSEGSILLKPFPSTTSSVNQKEAADIIQKIDRSKYFKYIPFYENSYKISVEFYNGKKLIIKKDEFELNIAQNDENRLIQNFGRWILVSAK